jgi:hypothetical protein
LARALNANAILKKASPQMMRSMCEIIGSDRRFMTFSQNRIQAGPLTVDNLQEGMTARSEQTAG